MSTPHLFKRTFDPQCLRLAEHFLPYETKERQEQLAQVIQDAIEDELEDPR